MAPKVGKKILVVEDDEDFSSILKMKFEVSGFSVALAKDGESAVEAALQEKPDLILSDILLPKMNGIEMAKKIKEQDKNVFIVFLTNLTDLSYVQEVKKLGFDYWVKSELSISDIAEKIRAKLGV